MPTLASELRNKLERVVVDARETAEAGARAALEVLAVHEPKYYSHMSAKQQELRNHLRARARQLGDRQDASGRLAIDHLVGECAYEHWHRMLFARFLAENGLLIEPQENMAVSLSEAEELAKEAGVDVWVFASRCAQDMLPQIFRPDDPLLQVSFAREHRVKLEGLVDSLPQAVFTASDALGWVYQFWQSKKKDEVIRSEVKIGADEIAAVTQLFTEPYMVEFLLHNTLGAWWAGKKLEAKDAASTKTEDELRRRLSLPGVGWEYLRFVRESDGTVGPWRPAAGTFNGWPKAAKDIKVLDPCCGSGHFLVAVLYHLVPVRIAEEGLSAREAVDAVLRDNLHGLEIDERCCQIAAFALAFAAWTYPDTGGYRALPDMHIACTGIGPQSTEEQWLRLAEQSGIPIPTTEQQRIYNGLLNLHRLFSQAPTLGSLIDPATISADLYVADYKMIEPYLAAIFKAERANDETRERAIAASGMLKAADLLARDYTLVVTNVPYLGRSKQSEIIQAFADKYYRDGRADLATIFLRRSFSWVSSTGTIAMVTPQTWLFLTSYRKLRERLLKERTWNVVVRLGSNAFRGMNWWAATTALVCISNSAPNKDTVVLGIDTSEDKSQDAKADMLRGAIPAPIVLKLQEEQKANPDARITFGEVANYPLVGTIADFGKGCSTGDADRFIVQFWELAWLTDNNCLWLNAPRRDFPSEGRRRVTTVSIDAPCLREQKGCWIRGQRVWNHQGIAFFLMNRLISFVYEGEIFDNIIGVLVPRNPDHLPAFWCWARSEEFLQSIRQVDQKAYVTPATLSKVPLDIDHWQARAAEKGILSLPEPESDDPTLWVFHGRPEESTTPLHVAVARLLGYRWPAELDDKMRLSKRARALVRRCEELTKFADDDGIVCIPSVRGEEPASERLLALLVAAGVNPTKVRELTGGVDLDDWLRNGFFEEHSKMFHDRPFVWHIWDGRKRDGFHALINYHKLCEGDGKGRRLLESLTYAYLGDWITRQKDGAKRGEGGAEDRLAAALELQKRLESILAGEPPFDLFIRWKPLAEQPIGWEPDINDGVRLNIRPFLASDLLNGRTGAGVLRYKPNIRWAKDRGKEPNRSKSEYPWFCGWDEKSADFLGGRDFDGNRWNDCHYTNKTKQAARDVAKGAKRG